jgi:hypothetical protein
MPIRTALDLQRQSLQNAGALDDKNGCSADVHAKVGAARALPHGVQQGVQAAQTAVS